jgi:DNA-nicking Smr family endonuclease
MRSLIVPPTVRRRPNREETRLWRLVTQDVTPMNGATPPRPEDLPESIALPQRQARAGVPPRPSPPSPPPAMEAVAVLGLERRLAARLRKGSLAIESRIDLHGHTQAEAHAALNAFITNAFTLERRRVLVITGKGTGHEDGSGVLRRVVPHWLNLPPNREKVLAIGPAGPRDGGEGALYVVLRRRR